MKKEEYYKIIHYIADIIKGTYFENQTYAVGGCCRDLVMGNDIHDIDICVEMPNGGIKFAKFMEQNGYTTNNVVIYETYGTAMFHLKEFNGVEIECVMTRGEQYHDKNSRNPQVTYASLEEDCFRRDLTINALYHNISQDKIIDPTNKGLSDIKSHYIRVTNENPNIVFQDDPLRMLRCVRFASRFGWVIESNTFSAIERNKELIPNVITQERITDEFSKMMSEGNPVEALKLLKITGLMPYVIKEIVDTYDLKQNDKHFGTVYEHTLKTIDGALAFADKYLIKYNRLLLCVTALLHDIGKIKTYSVVDDKIHFYGHEYEGTEMAREILKRMKYSNKFIEKVCFLIKNHMTTKRWGDDCRHMKINKLRKLQYKCNDLETFLILLAVIDGDNNAHKTEYNMPNQAYNILTKTSEMLDEGDDMFGYVLPINGNDIMERYGLKPGPDIQRILSNALKTAFNNRYIGKEECLNSVKGIIKEIKHKEL